MAQSQIKPHNLSLVFLSLDPPPAQCSFRNEARVSEQPGEFQLGQRTQITNAWGLNTWHLGASSPPTQSGGCQAHVMCTLLIFTTVV